MEIQEAAGKRVSEKVARAIILLQGPAVVKSSPAHAGDIRLDPWVGKIPCWRKWQPTPVFLPGKSHGQRSLAGESPNGHKESDTTEQVRMHAY